LTCRYPVDKINNGQGRKTNIKQGKTTMTNFMRVNNDSNGNPRYVCHFLTIADDYQQALILAKTIGGKRFRAKYFGGGVVFQSYSLPELGASIEAIKMAKK
jgi:hypothetical protein